MKPEDVEKQFDALCARMDLPMLLVVGVLYLVLKALFGGGR